MNRRRIELVAFDMEGCLTADPTVWEIMHRKLGTWQSHGLPYWDAYRAGEIHYDEFARMDVAVWTGAPAGLLHEAAREVPLMAGCAELLAALRQRRVRAAVISNGLACVADPLRSTLGIEHVFANRAVADDGRLTGELEVLVPYEGKAHVLSELTQELGLSREQVAAVGDSPSDAAMFRAAGLSVAFCSADRSVAEAATHVVARPDLRDLLPLLAP